MYGSQWDRCSTTLIKVESYAETALTSTRTTLLLVCVYHLSIFTILSFIDFPMNELVRVSRELHLSLTLLEALGKPIIKDTCYGWLGNGVEK